MLDLGAWSRHEPTSGDVARALCEAAKLFQQVAALTAAVEKLTGLVQNQGDLIRKLMEAVQMSQKGGER